MYKQLAFLTSLFPLDVKLEHCSKHCQISKTDLIQLNNKDHQGPLKRLRHSKENLLNCLLAFYPPVNQAITWSLGLESELAYYYVNPAKLPYIPISAVQLEPAPITDHNIPLLLVQYISLLSKYVCCIGASWQSIKTGILFYSTTTSTTLLLLCINLSN